jgi:hypothetical protein
MVTVPTHGARALLMLAAMPLQIRAQLTGRDLDLFSYGETTVDANGNNVFGPKDWGKIQCPDLDLCVSNMFYVRS